MWWRKKYFPPVLVAAKNPYRDRRTDTNKNSSISSFMLTRPCTSTNISAILQSCRKSFETRKGPFEQDWSQFTSGIKEFLKVAIKGGEFLTNFLKELFRKLEMALNVFNLCKIFPHKIMNIQWSELWVRYVVDNPYEVIMFLIQSFM